MRRPLSIWSLLILLPSSALARTGATEFWVDSNSLQEGRGTSAEPFRSLQSALERSAAPKVIHLKAGLYRGPLEIPGEVTLLGDGEVVIHSEGDEPFVLSSRGKVALRQLQLSGGQVAIVSYGELSLENVSMSAFRKQGLAVNGRLQFEGGRIEGTVSETIGLSLKNSPGSRVHKVRFSGALRRAVEARDSELEVTECAFDGPVTAVHQKGGRVSVMQSAISGGRGPALFAAAGVFRLRAVRVSGHEFGLQTGAKAELDVVDFLSLRPERAGIALSNSTGVLRDLVVVETGSYGGIQLIESRVLLERVRIHRAVAFGVFARKGELQAQGVLISEVQAEESAGHPSGGDGIQLYGGRHRLSDVRVMNVEGLGVLSSMYAETRLADFTCEKCRWGGLSAEQMSTVDASSVSVERSLWALAVPDEAVVRLGHLNSIKNTEGAIWADCRSNTQITVQILRADAPLRNSKCVEVGRLIQVENPP